MNGSIAERGRRTAQIALVVSVAVGILVLEACSDSPSTNDDTTTAVEGGGSSTDGATDPGSSNGPDTDAGTDPAATDEPTTTTEPPTTTTTLAVITKNAVVKVANAAGVPGAAGRFTQTLQAVGYPVADPTDAAGYEIRLDVSKVYYRDNAAKAGKRLAALMGVEAFPMPTPVPILEANAALGDATIVVMLGKDLADEAIPGLTDR